MISHLICLVCWFAMVVSSPARATKDVLGYPEVEENTNIRNKQGRQPLYSPTICSENQLYYPGDQEDDWICDCRPAYIYDPTTDKCWPTWQQGPCAEGEYLVLENASVIPVCQPNRCRQDGFILWNGKCEKFGSQDVCKHLYPNAAVLGVNATTLEVGCIYLSLDRRFQLASPTTTSRPRPNTKLRPTVLPRPTVSPQKRPQVTCPHTQRDINGQCPDL